jgi:ubiquitin thioesterase protein OTUB1
MNPETFQPISVDQFCLSEVEPCSREADQVQIMALARCLKQGVRVCYLDGSDVGGSGEANFVELEMGDGEGLGEDPITLLYRVSSRRCPDWCACSGADGR